ncbi:iron transport multicopper oxidase Fet3p [Trichomonascus vanleenenianus]|uniref:ferroxidase FET3 n=1 Tax=Trichomonascus vanleenenianus TaxID=2268995 RepID=UPI003EC96FF3
MKFTSWIAAGAAALAAMAQAKTVTYDWDVSWVNANPDGLMERKVIGINGAWPLPRVEVDKGDRVVVNMYNKLEDTAASIHFHGLYQNGTNHMDGPPGLTQCAVPPGSNITYNFTVDQNGTYWYHTHVMGSYPDGYRGPFIVHDKDAPFEFDEEFTVTLSDWYHELMEEEEKSFLSLYNPSGAEPIPSSMLFNDTQHSSLAVEPNKTYLIRLINIGAFSSMVFYIEDHELEIVEVDGIYTEPKTVDKIYITAAQRYAFLVKTKNTTTQNFPIVTVFDADLFDFIPPDLALNQTNWLEYNKSAPHEEAVIPYETFDDIPFFDDFELVPYDRMELLPEPDLQINVTVVMTNLNNGVNYAFFNNITYTAPKVPSLYTVMSSGDLVMDERIYGEFTHPYILKHNDVVEVIVNNADSGTHPFHLHGHAFQLIDRSPAFDDDDITPYDPSNHTAFPQIPIRRDVAYVRPNGYYVLRFRADNPGVWFFHCHIEWHMDQGLAMTFIEAPDVLQKTLQIPEGHYDVCRAAGLQYKGNAAGNETDFLNLAGQNAQHPDLPPGFTARGIVALVFSCVSAFLGMATIAWYGMSDLSKTDSIIVAHEEGLDEESAVDEPVITPIGQARA